MSTVNSTGRPTASDASAAVDRPSVSVIVPFGGGDVEAARLAPALSALRLRPQDELIVVDNNRSGTVHLDPALRCTVLLASAQRSSYYARNVGAEHAANPWLLFLDADCRPDPDVLDAYFSSPLDERCGAVAGGVVADRAQHGLIARFCDSRQHLDQTVNRAVASRPFGVTANLLVRKRAWAEIGGFQERIRSGGDGELCYRLQDAGWHMDLRPRATVEHRHRETLRDLTQQMRRYGAGRAWMNRRYPGSFPHPQPIRALARCAAGMLIWTLRGRWESAGFKALDALTVLADLVGYLSSNATASGPPSESARTPIEQPSTLTPVAVISDWFPALSETFVAAEARALSQLGHRVRIEAASRPQRADRAAGRAVTVSYLEDDSILRKALDLAWLIARAPRACARDLLSQRGWRREEEVRGLHALAPVARRLAHEGARHLHAHFATGAALDAMRLAALLDMPYSVTAHAFDIFTPRNLPAKLERAAFVTTGCAYNVEHLRATPGVRADVPVHEVIMGVDGERFRRRRPYPGGRTVLAIGRLVEKKGFAHLIDAIAELQQRAPVQRLRIVGAGPLHDVLQAQAERLNVAATVDLLGACDPETVRELLECADILAMPSVIAPDGDRDSMPVVVKEALAMEVPVVASDEVGLPEVVRPAWGRLVAPGDARALARAIEELLALPIASRVEMGRAGRAFVLEHCNLQRETAKVSQLIATGHRCQRPIAGGGSR